MRYENFMNFISQSMFAWNEFTKDENMKMFFLEYSLRTIEQNGRLLLSQDGKKKTGVSVLRGNAKGIRCKNRRISPLAIGLVFDQPSFKSDGVCHLTEIMERVEENSLIKQRSEFKSWCESEGLI